MSETTAKKDVQKLQRVIVDALEDVKALDIAVFNTEHLSPLFERVIIASGNSNRQTKALSASVRDKVRESGFGKPRIEGEDNGEWIIADCGAAVVHIMQPVIRQYYNLEEIWGDKPVRLKLGAPKPVAKTAAKTTAKTTAKTATKTASKAAGQGRAPAADRGADRAPTRSSRAAGQAAAKGAAKTASKPVSKSASKPASKPANPASAKRSAAGATPLPRVVVGKPSAKKAVKAATKAATKTATKSTRKAAPKRAPAGQGKSGTRAA